MTFATIIKIPKTNESRDQDLKSKNSYNAKLVNQCSAGLFFFFLQIAVFYVKLKCNI